MNQFGEKTSDKVSLCKLSGDLYTKEPALNLAGKIEVPPLPKVTGERRGGTYLAHQSDFFFEYRHFFLGGRCMMARAMASGGAKMGSGVLV